MKVILLDAPESLLEERRRLGLDAADEMWEGVVHMVPPAAGPHQRLGAALLAVLYPVARARGLEPHYAAGLFRTAQDYRVPDQMYVLPEALSDRGAEGAELVIEIRSANDETYDKIDFYAELGVRELLIIHPEQRRVELLRAVDRRLLPVSADASGAVRSDVLGTTFTTVEARLQIGWEGGSAVI